MLTIPGKLSRVISRSGEHRSGEGTFVASTATLVGLGFTVGVLVAVRARLGVEEGAGTDPSAGRIGFGKGEQAELSRSKRAAATGRDRMKDIVS